MLARPLVLGRHPKPFPKPVVWEAAIEPPASTHKGRPERILAQFASGDNTKGCESAQRFDASSPSPMCPFAQNGFAERVNSPAPVGALVCLAAWQIDMPASHEGEN
jgi:hypothetical protein